jgi:hypothetical protein
MDVRRKGGETRTLTRRFRLETALALLAVVLAALTAAWPEWIEAIFGVDPDGGNGTLEWAVVAALGLAAVTFALLARAEWATQAAVAGRGRAARR